MSFTCECGCHKFYGSHIQGGMRPDGPNLDLLSWSVIFCLRCGKKYLWDWDCGFKAFDPELVK